MALRENIGMSLQSQAFIVMERDLNELILQNSRFFRLNRENPSGDGFASDCLHHQKNQINQIFSRERADLPKGRKPDLGKFLDNSRELHCQPARSKDERSAQSDSQGHGDYAISKGQPEKVLGAPRLHVGMTANFTSV